MYHGSSKASQTAIRFNINILPGFCGLFSVLAVADTSDPLHRQAHALSRHASPVKQRHCAHNNAGPPSYHRFPKSLKKSASRKQILLPSQQHPRFTNHPTRIHHPPNPATKSRLQKPIPLRPPITPTSHRHKPFHQPET